MTIFLYPLKVDNKKLVYYASFTEDLIPIVKMLNEKMNVEIILIYHPRIEKEINQLNVKEKYPHANKNVVKELYHLMTSKFIIVDTYYLILGGLKKKKGQYVLQTWHASGALKKFGLEDQALTNRTEAEVRQYKQVYNSFDYILVASDKMGEIFQRSFAVKESQLLKIGLPRMDSYFERNVIEARRDKIREELQITSNEKMVLYVPTYREDEQKMSSLPIDFTLLNEGFRPFVKLHPVVETTFNSEILSNRDTEDLLIASDIVITDYSSLAIEASLLDKPIYFYTYDKEKYNAEKGLIDDFDEAVNFQYYETNEALIEALNTEKSSSSIKMNEIWNPYNDGRATARLIEWMKQVK